MEDKKMMGMGMYHGKNWYLIIGTVALVWGLSNWAAVMYMWAPYTTWIVAGIILILIGWIKKWMKMGMYKEWKM